MSSTAVRPMRTRVPVAMGPVTTNSPSVIRVTLPVTVSGLPVRLICGMSILPPSVRVTLAAVPAAMMRATSPGSQIGPGHHVVEALAHHLLDHAHHVLRAARGGVVAVVDEDDRALAERARVRDLAGQRRALVEEGLAPLPGHAQQPLEQRLARHRPAGRRRSPPSRRCAGCRRAGSRRTRTR